MNATIPVTAYTVTLSILIYLINRADRGEFDGILGPLEPAEVDELRHMSVRDLLRLTDQKRPILGISIDTRQLRGCMSRLRSRSDGEVDKLWFVRRGAQQSLMTELFGVSEREFRDLRRHAGIAEQRGRPQTLKSANAQAVVEHWQAIDPRLPLAVRYRRLGESFPDLSMASLYAAIHDQK
nr:DUF2857 family protein [Zoogloeaceae bacterium]